MKRCRVDDAARAGVLYGLVLSVSFLLSGCGFVPSESKLAGAWQVDLQRPSKIVYVFQKDHTYTMTISAQSGAIHGRWKLEGNLLTLTMGSFVAQGMTNPLPVIKGMNTQKNIVVRLTDSSMTWRTGFLGGRLKFKRMPAPAPAGPATGLNAVRQIIRQVKSRPNEREFA